MRKDIVLATHKNDRELKKFLQSYRYIQPLKTTKPMERKMKIMTSNSARKVHAMMPRSTLPASAFVPAIYSSRAARE
jgi:hypothetical protein